MQSVAQSWLVYRLTHSAVLLGTVALVSQIPVLLFGSLAGVVADRLHRWNIVVATQVAFMLSALALAYLTATGRVQVWHIFVVAAFTGIVNAFDIPARQAFIKEMVGREDMMNAIALNSSMFNGARLVGPAIAGLLLGWAGEGWCFFLNGISYLAVLAGLFMMKLKHVPAAQDDGTILERMREGFDYVRSHKAVWVPMALLGVASITAMPYVVLMPVFADRVLHGGAKALGLLMSAGGFGALVSALWLARRQSVRGLSAIIGMAAVGFGVNLVLFSLSHQLALSCALLVPVGFCIMTQMAASNTLIQSMVPDEFRGRVMSFYTIMFLGVAPVGSMLAGAMAHLWGAPVAVALGGACSVLSGSVFLLNRREYRRAAREMLAEQGNLPAVSAPR